VHQTWEEKSGPKTAVKITANGITPQMLQGFFYNFAKEMPAAQSNLRLSKIGSCEEGVDVHHMRIITPFIVSNRSMFVSWYHLLSREENGEYTFVASQAGNDNFAR